MIETYIYDQVDDMKINIVRNVDDMKNIRRIQKRALYLDYMWRTIEDRVSKRPWCGSLPMTISPIDLAHEKDMNILIFNHLAGISNVTQLVVLIVHIPCVPSHEEDMNILIFTTLKINKNYLYYHYQSQSSKRSTVIALFLKVNFSKLSHNGQIFGNYFVCIPLFAL